MWVHAQLCRGDSGEKLRRADWKPLGRGKLTIRQDGKLGLSALLHHIDVQGRPHQLTWPLFDVRVATYDAGFIVVGYRIQSEESGKVVREIRQAWYCVPG